MSLERLAWLGERLGVLAEQHRDVPPGEAVPGEHTPFEGSRLTARAARELFVSQLTARHLDRMACELRARNEGYYTITSAGHEGNAVVGRLLRAGDPALLHYRSGALFVERARKAPEVDPVEAVVLGLTASRDDPIAGGRHKVFGSVELDIPPQTSTVASHLPKAVGTALCIDRAHKMGVAPHLPRGPVPKDALVVCSLGDASLNHASATTALNAMRWVTYQGLPLPLLLVCEDNGLGISVRTPREWVSNLLRSAGELCYFTADGWDLAAAFEAASCAFDTCRTRRRPVVLHLRCARLLGHSGADPDTVYRKREELEQAARRDPICCGAALLLERGIMSALELERLDRDIAGKVERAADAAAKRPKLASPQEIMASVATHSAEREHAEATRSDYRNARLQAFGKEAFLPENLKPAPLSRLINWALHDLMAKYPECLMFGEDIAEKGGVYNVTAGLWKRWGGGRVFNTLLDETTILGLAQGAGGLGLLPVPEIQYLAFVHNAEDQLRGEAATMSFFSRGQFRNPMVVRIGSLGYQKGFGGHFHNDNSLAVLRDIPGLVLACPSNGADAVRLLRTCFAAARVDGRVVVFLEPIALYGQHDLYEAGDRAYQCAFPPPGDAARLGEPAVYEPDGCDLTIVSYGNGLRLSRRAARRLRDEAAIRCRVVDLRWLAPLPLEAVSEHARATGALLIVDECRRAGNVGETLASHAATDPALSDVKVGLVTAHESFIPLGDAAELVLPSELDIVGAARELAVRASNRSRKPKVEKQAGPEPSVSPLPSKS